MVHFEKRRLVFSLICALSFISSCGNRAAGDFDRGEGSRRAREAKTKRARDAKVTFTYRNNRDRDIVIIRQSETEAYRNIRVKPGEAAVVSARSADKIIVKDDATTGKSIDEFKVRDRLSDFN